MNILPKVLEDIIIDYKTQLNNILLIEINNEIKKRNNNYSYLHYFDVVEHDIRVIKLKYNVNRKVCFNNFYDCCTNQLKIINDRFIINITENIKKYKINIFRMRI